MRPRPSPGRRPQDASTQRPSMRPCSRSTCTPRACPIPIWSSERAESFASATSSCGRWPTRKFLGHPRALARFLRKGPGRSPGGLPASLPAVRAGGSGAPAVKRLGVAWQPERPAGGGLKARVATAVVGAPLLLGALWLGGLPWLILVAAVGLLGAPEVARLYGRGGWRAPSDGLILAVLWPIGLAYLAGEGLVDLPGPRRGPCLPFPSFMVCAGTLPAPPPTPHRGCGLGRHPGLLGRVTRPPDPLAGPASGLAWSLVLVAGTWGADIAAYFIGRQWGRRRLAPHLSPGKTVEGTVAGLVAGLASAGLVGWGWA